MLTVLFIFFCGCVGTDYQTLASRTIHKNSLIINQANLQKRIEASPECNITGKTIDALASFGYFTVFEDDNILVKKEANITLQNQDYAAFSISKMYDRGYKIEAKQKAMELLSLNQPSFTLLVTMAKIYESDGDYRGATLFYTDAINIKPKDEATNFALARLYYLQKKPKLAIKYAKIADSFNGLENKNIKDLIFKIEKINIGGTNE